MKKSYLILAAAALVFAACANNDVKQNIEETEALGFNTYADKVTRATSATNLEGFHQTFGVWADKNTTDPATVVMSHYKVVYDADYTTPSPAAQWNYEDVSGQYLKYWDKAATQYTFDAYAPYSSNASISNHVISIASGQYAANENIQASWSTTQNTAAFSGTGDTSTSESTDWMIATQATRNPNTSTAKVDLAFGHILSKVVVKIIKKSGFKPKITVKDVTLNNVYGTGSYNGTAWSTGTATTVDVDCLEGVLPATNGTEAHKAYYALECLVIPATVTPTFSVTYTIGDDDEEFVVEDAEIATITSFAKNNNYVITVTIGPDPIQFDATVTPWTDADEADVTVD